MLLATCLSDRPLFNHNVKDHFAARTRVQFARMRWLFPTIARLSTLPDENEQLAFSPMFYGKNYVIIMLLIGTRFPLETAISETLRADR